MGGSDEVITKPDRERMVWKDCARPGVGWGSCGEGTGRERMASVLLGWMTPSDTACYVLFPLGRLNFKNENPKSIIENFP